MKEKICQRCHKPTFATIMSMFNMDIICMECKDKERNHPRYKEACDAEMAAKDVKDFPGIGKPHDL